MRHKSSGSIAGFLSVVVLALCGVQPGYSATINPASCEQEVVQAALDVAQNGDVVAIPPGSCTWTTKVTISKGVTLQGGGIGITIIKDGVATGALLDWDCAPNLPHRMTGLEFQDGGRAINNFEGIVRMDCTNVGSTTFRIDHNKFNLLNGVGLRPSTLVGVIDHNIFITTPLGWRSIFTIQIGTDSMIAGATRRGLLP